LAYIQHVSPDLTTNYKDCNHVENRSKTQPGEVNDLKIYPNPASESISLSIPEGAIRHLKIRSMEGIIILDVESKSREIDIQILKEGVYIVEAHLVDGSVRTGKFIKI
jgi:hypothetical protein